MRVRRKRRRRGGGPEHIAGGGSWRRTASEALASLLARPLGMLTPALGTMVGVAAAVGALSVDAAAQRQVSSTFSAVSARQVTVSPVDGSGPLDLPGDIDARLGSLAGVESGGVIDTYNAMPVSYSGWLSEAEGESGRYAAAVSGVSPGGLAAADPTITELYPGAPDYGLCGGCALIGAALAPALGKTVRLGGSVLVDGTPFLVVGELDDVVRSPQLLSSVVVNESDAADLFPTERSVQGVVIQTVPGAAQQVARQAPAAIDPDEAGRMSASAPPQPTFLSQSVGSNLTQLALALAGISLVTGLVGISASFSSSVWQRRSEFGLRRALGATRRDIRRQVLVEATVVGSVGGLLGAILGLLASLVVAAVNHWQPTVDLVVLVVAPLAGVGCGVMAGALPARRAGTVEPSAALRAP